MAALLLTFAYGCGGASTRVTYPAERSARSAITSA